MNRGQLRLRVVQTLSLDDTVGGEEITLASDLLNQGVQDIISRTRLSMKCLDINLAANKDLFDIPDSVLVMDGVYDTEGNRWIRKVPELVDEDGEFALIGHDLLKVAPSGQARTLHAYMVPMPAPMTADAHDPSDEVYGGIPVQFHQAIINYACWQLGVIFEQEGSGAGERYRIFYEGKDSITGDLLRIKRFTNKRILPAGRRRPPVDGYVSRNYI